MAPNKPNPGFTPGMNYPDLSGTGAGVKIFWLVGPAAIFGALGGLINAWFVYANAFGTLREMKQFPWTILPAGAFHGALLAAVPVYCAFAFWNRPKLERWIAAPLVGWVSAWLSFAAIHGVISENYLGSPIWCFQPSVEALYIPFCYFGLVGAFYYVKLNVLRGLASKSLPLHLAYGVASGVLGSLWWWIAWQRWHFSLIHGTIWGVLVGFSIWRFAKTRGGDL